MMLQEVPSSLSQVRIQCVACSSWLKTGFAVQTVCILCQLPPTILLTLSRPSRWNPRSRRDPSGSRKGKPPVSVHHCAVLHETTLIASLGLILRLTLTNIPSDRPWRSHLLPNPYCKHARPICKYVDTILLDHASTVVTLIFHAPLTCA